MSHEIEIVVNGKQKTVEEKELTFEEVVKLAYPDANLTDDTKLYTVTFKRANGHKPEGELLKGETLKIKKETVINVVGTIRS